KTGGRFILQVNLSRPELPQSVEHRRMHPSPLTLEQVMAWLGAKSEQFQHFVESAPNRDNEVYFLSWGYKMRDEPVAYRRPSIAQIDPSAAAPDAASPPDAPEATAPRPLTSTFASAWRTATTIKGGIEPAASLHPIAAIVAHGEV